MLYVGLWLLTMTILRALHSNVVTWTGVSIAIMGVVVSLRKLHPGIEVPLTGETQFILLSVSSVVGEEASDLRGEGSLAQMLLISSIGDNHTALERY